MIKNEKAKKKKKNNDTKCFPSAITVALNHKKL